MGSAETPKAAQGPVLWLSSRESGWKGVRRENGFASSAFSQDSGQPAPPVPASAPGFS